MAQMSTCSGTAAELKNEGEWILLAHRLKASNSNDAIPDNVVLYGYADPQTCVWITLAHL